MHAAVVDTLFGRERKPVRWCSHRAGRSTDGPTLVHAALRFAGCPSCCTVEYGLHAARLEADNACDVCGEVDVSGTVRPRVLPLGPMLVTLHTGPCCDPLFDYASPVGTTRIVQAPGRNEPCPCGSGRKYKHCHIGREVAW
jgi:hypothetical protein